MSQWDKTVKQFSPLTHLGDLSIDIFYRDYWQKNPLLIRQAFKDFPSLISPEELAGLSLEEDVNARLVIENGQQWEVEHGPLDDTRFTHLPDNRWTLLVQHVDSLDPRINALLQAFRFLPNWRLDDIMVSYATDGGGVGPHFDYYDVFLLQAEGTRRWRLGQTCSAQSTLVPDQPMKILTDFQTTDEWLVEPGDLLYVPARLAHWGEAVGNCMTYSIGFRAPSHADFLLDYCQEVVTNFSEDQRYVDPPSQNQGDIGEVSPQAIHYFQALLQSLSEDRDALAQWLGHYSTHPKQQVFDDLYEPATIEDLESNTPCKLSEYQRVCYTKYLNQARCFINGEEWQCSLTLAKQLSQYQVLEYSHYDHDDKSVLAELIERQWLTLA